MDTNAFGYNIENKLFVVKKSTDISNGKNLID